MKKILAVALAACLSFGLVFAQEEESKPIGSPSFKAKNTLSVSGKNDKEGNFSPTKVKNTLKANFAIGFELNEKFSITPFVSNEAAFKSSNILLGNSVIPFDSNVFKLGLEFGMTPAEMFGIAFNAGYLTEIAPDIAFASQPIGYNAQGFFLGTGIDVNVENFFIAAKLGYDLEAKFGKKKYDTGDKKILKGKIFEHTVGTELVFDFFNFMKDGLNSGLVIANEFKATQEDANNLDKDPTVAGKGNKLENDFGIGLHFNPVKYFDFTFLTKVGYETGKEYDTNNKKWNDPAKTTTVGLSLASVFKHKNFIFEVVYNPTLKKKEVASNGTVTKFEKKEKEHEFKVAIGFAF